MFKRKQDLEPNGEEAREREREQEEARRRLARVEASLRVLVPTAHLMKVRRQHG